MNTKGVSGIAGILEIKLDENNGKFLSGNFISTKQIGKGYPVVDKSKKAIKFDYFLAITYDRRWRLKTNRTICP